MRGGRWKERPGRKSSGGVCRQAFSSERGASIAAGEEDEDDYIDHFCHASPLAIYTFHLICSNSLLVVPIYDVINADWSMLNQAQAWHAGWLLSFCA